jgi:GNAT superfamily N-acetyltransferase
MIVIPFPTGLITQVRGLMELGGPYVRARTDSDYWLYARLFSSTCPVALVDGDVAGVVIAFRSQDHPDDIYIQDVMTHPRYRRRGIARRLLHHLRDHARDLGCARLYLTCEPENTVGRATWTSLGFENLPGNRVVDGVAVIADLKGPGKDRAIYQLPLER